MDNTLLNTQEVADLLKIARNTVYEIIKRGDLPFSKVGKQVRIQRQDVEAYLSRTRSGLAPVAAAHPPAQEIPRQSNVIPYPQPFVEDTRGHEFIICGQDISLDILINHLNMSNDFLQVYRSYLGSYNSIYALYHGRVNVATTHLWDGDQNEYNVSYVKKMLPGIPALIMRIGKRQHGFYIKKKNPKSITDWTDLKRNDISIVNREKGSGTRVLLDEKLRLMGISGENIKGYSNEYKSHVAVATAVSQGLVDVALGSETGFKNVDGIDFIPLQPECYDLIIRKSDADKQPYRQILDIVASSAFKKDLESLGGYDTQETGKIIW